MDHNAVNGEHNEQENNNQVPTPETASVTPPTTPPAAPEPMWQPQQATVYEAPASSLPPAPAVNTVPDTSSVSLAPQPVVNVLSPRGVEYVFLILSLFTAAIGLAGALLAAVNGAMSFSSLSFPVALLLVGLPLFAWLFLRLKKAELMDPSLALDASKRRSTQTTQIICFLVVLFSLIGLVSAIMAKIGGQLGESMVKVILDVLVLVVVFGGILAYYWRDEHRG